MTPKQIRSNQSQNNLMTWLIGLAAVVTCSVCAMSYYFMGRNQANYEASLTRVAGMPPTETALPPSPTPTVVPTETVTPEPPVLLILDVARLLDAQKNDVTAYLGQPTSDDPILADDDIDPFARGGTTTVYSPTIDDHELFIVMDFSREERSVLLVIMGLEPWGIRIDEWKSMARRLHLPFSFDDTSECQHSFHAGPLGRNWDQCHGYEVSFFADPDTKLIREFHIRYAAP